MVGVHEIIFAEKSLNLDRKVWYQIWVCCGKKLDLALTLPFFVMRVPILQKIR